MNYLKKYNISIEQYSKWISFNVYDLNIIQYLQNKNFHIDTLLKTNTNLKEYLNNIDTVKFFELMGIDDIRAINGYLYDWKYTSNNKRFFKILNDYYGIDTLSIRRTFE